MDDDICRISLVGPGARHNSWMASSLSQSSFWLVSFLDSTWAIGYGVSIKVSIRKGKYSSFGCGMIVDICAVKDLVPLRCKFDDKGSLCCATYWLWRPFMKIGSCILQPMQWPASSMYTGLAWWFDLYANGSIPMQAPPPTTTSTTGTLIQQQQQTRCRWSKKIPDRRIYNITACPFNHIILHCIWLFTTTCRSLIRQLV